MQPTELTKEGELFFRQYLRSPRSVGSVIPSSRALGRGVAAETAWEPGQYVVELGGGTGSITMGLIERGIPRDRLVVIELDGPMHAYLKERLPGVNVIQGDATRLDEILVRHGVDDVATVISGMPMVGQSDPVAPGHRRPGHEGGAPGRLHAAVQLLARGADPGEGFRRDGQARPLRALELPAGQRLEVHQAAA